MPIWLSVTESEDDNGNKIFVGVFKDLRAVNPTSRSTQNKMLMLLDNLVDSAIVINTESVIIFFNKSAEQFFGFAREEVIGNSVEMLMPPDVAKTHKQFVDNYMKTRQGKVIGRGRVVEVMKKDASIHAVFLSLSETKWGENNSIAFCATIQQLQELADAKKSAGNQAKKVEEQRIEADVDETTIKLQEILDRPVAHLQFKCFLEQIHCCEPLLFIEAVDEFKVLKSHAYRYNCGRMIYETFVKSNSPKELNLASSVRQDLLAKFVEGKVNGSHCPANLFDRACDAVFVDLKNDCFNRFMQTDAFKTLQSIELQLSLMK